MKLLRRIYSLYGVAVFMGVYLMFLPVFAYFIQTKNIRHPIIFKLHRVWAHLFYWLTLIPIHIEYRQKPNPKGQYIFCSNHFSYLDIPAIGVNNVGAAFVGKSSLGKIPVFGYMYRNIHITLDRNKLKSRYSALTRSFDELDKGHSLVMFPEGGIATKNPPVMNRFKDGAFRAAIEKQIPIVPVTIPYNWIILPDDGKFLLHRHRNVVIFHEAIQTRGMSLDQLDELKEKVYNIIEQELKKYNPDEYRQEHIEENRPSGQT